MEVFKKKAWLIILDFLDTNNEWYHLLTSCAWNRNRLLMGIIVLLTHSFFHSFIGLFSYLFLFIFLLIHFNYTIIPFHF